MECAHAAHIEDTATHAFGASSWIWNIASPQRPTTTVRPLYQFPNCENNGKLCRRKRRRIHAAGSAHLRDTQINTGDLLKINSWKSAFNSVDKNRTNFFGLVPKRAFFVLAKRNATLSPPGERAVYTVIQANPYCTLLCRVDFICLTTPDSSVLWKPQSFTPKWVFGSNSGNAPTSSGKPFRNFTEVGDSLNWQISTSPMPRY